ncbi:MAG TPA: MFS transporter [Chitinophagaceae bacterium]|nr:MFS transporter [Chitinophagaceae bacterium]
MLSATAKTYRNAYSGLSKETWLLSVVMLINRSGTMVVPFMTLYLTSTQMGFTIGQAGIVFGLFGAGAFSGALLGGYVTDRIGFYPVQLITLLGGGILFIVLGQMKTYETICIFTYAVSFVNEAFRPANSTAIAFYSKTENRTRSYALNRLAINLGWAVGSAMGGVIISKFGYQALFWVDGITNISAAVFMFFFLKPVDYKPSHQKTAGNVPKKRSAFRDVTYLWFILVTMLFAACFFQLFTNIPVYFQKELHLSELFIGILMALNGVIIALIEMVLVYKFEGRQRNAFLITLGVGLVGVSFLSLTIPAGGALIALFMIIVVTFGEILSMPFMNTYWISRTVPANRGQYAGLYTMAWSAAQCLGPLLAAQLAEHQGFRILWWVIGGLSLIASACFYSILNKKEHAPALEFEEETTAPETKVSTISSGNIEEEITKT